MTETSISFSLRHQLKQPFNNTFTFFIIYIIIYILFTYYLHIDCTSKISWRINIYLFQIQLTGFRIGLLSIVAVGRIASYSVVNQFVVNRRFGLYNNLHTRLYTSYGMNRIKTLALLASKPVLIFSLTFEYIMFSNNVSTCASMKQFKRR